MRWFRSLRGTKTKSGAALRKAKVNGIALKFFDHESSAALEIVKRELEDDHYGIESMPFETDDVVIDIGGHVGIFSIYLAKRYPFVQIYAFEPMPESYQHFKQNIELNDVTNIEVYNKAVTHDGRTIDMIAHHSNTGGATANLKDMRLPEHSYYTVESVTLDGVFTMCQIDQCKLLKIDCEGSEHEILLNTTRLEQVQYLSGEFHINAHLSSQGYSIADLYAYCQRFIPVENIHYTSCHMAE